MYIYILSIELHACSLVRSISFAFSNSYCVSKSNHKFLEHAKCTNLQESHVFSFFMVPVELFGLILIQPMRLGLKAIIFFGSKPKLYKLQPAERAQISAKTNAHFHTFPQMTANWKNVSGNLESIDFSTWRFAGIWLTWSPYLANGCNSFRACPEYFDQKFEHFKVEHMWSSRNFRIEPRTKKMNENDTNGGPDVYILYLFFFGRGIKYWGKGLLCHPLSSSIDRSERSLLGKSPVHCAWTQAASQCAQQAGVIGDGYCSIASQSLKKNWMIGTWWLTTHGSWLWVSSPQWLTWDFWWFL